MSQPFLTARWEDLALVTYDCDPALVARYLPAGCLPDLVDGRARCSLVAFDFRDARVFGRHWPWHVNFPEVNLRFYVQRDGVRGISFLSEFVPRRAIAWIARAIYNEPYLTAAMRSESKHDADGLTIYHRLKVRGRWQQITVRGEGPAVVPEADPAADWIKEHRWGFGQTRGGRPLTYEVLHPKWAIYANATADLSFDFGHVYGPDWAFLTAATPTSVLLTAGSAVSVSPRKILSLKSASPGRP